MKFGIRSVLGLGGLLSVVVGAACGSNDTTSSGTNGGGGTPGSGGSSANHGGAAGISGASGGDAAGGGSAVGCATDADCKASAPTTSPPGCAVATCDPVARKCTYSAPDADGDHHTDAKCVPTTPGIFQAGDDCNDKDPKTYPGAWDGPAVDGHADECDMVDQDCNGIVDDDFGKDGSSCICAPNTTQQCAYDSTGLKINFPGGTAQGACKLGSQSCVVTAGKGGQWGPCDGAVTPQQFDSCAVKGNDENCNGKPNEGCDCTDDTPARTCNETAQGVPVTYGQIDPATGDPVGACHRGKQQCNSGKWGICTGATGAAQRDCSSKDDLDCDGLPDDTHDAVCACQPDDSTACKGGPNNCGGTRTCVFTKQSSYWEPCEAPNNCSCSPSEGAISCGDSRVGEVGTCAQGTANCVNGLWVCGTPAATHDSCDLNNDDSCNGKPNEGCGSCINGNACGAAATCNAGGVLGGCSPASPDPTQHCSTGTGVSADHAPGTGCDIGTGMGACAKGGTYECDGNSASSCHAPTGVPDTTGAFHAGRAPNGSADWNCDGFSEPNIDGDPNDDRTYDGCGGIDRCAPYPAASGSGYVSTTTCNPSTWKERVSTDQSDPDCCSGRYCLELCEIEGNQSLVVYKYFTPLNCR